METDDLLVPILFLMVAFSVILAEPLQEIERGIRKFPDKLILFFINPIFIIIIISIGFLSIILLVVFRYKSHIKNKKWELDEKERIKKLFEKSANNSDLDEDENTGEPDIKESDSYEPTPLENYQRSVNIKVDSDKRYFHKKDITKHEVKFLLDEGYQIKKYKNLLNCRMEDFLLQPRHNESLTHLFMTHNISEFLEKSGIETELYTTKKPDIVFEIRGKRFAIEIETGSIFSKISRMKEKLEVLKSYDKWFFVVTDRNKVKKYKKYGDAVDKRYVKSRLDKLVKLAKKSQK